MCNSLIKESADTVSVNIRQGERIRNPHSHCDAALAPAGCPSGAPSPTACHWRRLVAAPRWPRLPAHTSFHCPVLPAPSARSAVQTRHLIGTATQEQPSRALPPPNVCAKHQEQVTGPKAKVLQNSLMAGDNSCRGRCFLRCLPLSICSSRKQSNALISTYSGKKILAGQLRVPQKGSPRELTVFNRHPYHKPRVLEYK